MKNAFLSIAILTLLIGCGPAGPGPGNIHLKRPVSPSEAAGVWKLRGDCLTWLVNEKGYQALLAVFIR